MNTIGAVFARGGSKGIRRKNLQLIRGKPLVAYAVEAAIATPEIDRVIVSTDDDEIAQVGLSHGAEVPFVRPSGLARDDSPEWLAWQHAIRELEARSIEVETLVAIPPTSPTRDSRDISRCIQLLFESDADAVMTVRNARHNPYFNMVTLDESGVAQLLMTADPPPTRRQDAPPVYEITTVAYATRKNYVLDASHFFEGNVRAVVVDEKTSIDIDSELDLTIARCLMESDEGASP